MTLYSRIRQRREEIGLSQEALAKILGYKSRSTIAKIESGRNNITKKKIDAFAEALQTTSAFLLGYENDNELDMFMNKIKNISLLNAEFNSEIGCLSEKENACLHLILEKYINENKH